MNRILLPGTDLNVSRICLGTWQFNDGLADITWSGQDPKISRDIVKKAREEGINFFDTAEAYKNSEKVLGHVLDLQSHRGDVVIATKFGQNHPHGRQDYSAVDIEAALTRSLENLQTTYVDLYQVHWPLCMGDIEETIRQLELEKARGRIRHYGYCNFGELNMEGFHAAGGKPITNQLPYSLLWRATEYRILPKVSELNMAVLAYSPLQQGLLSGKFRAVHDVPEGRRRTRHFNNTSTKLSVHGQGGAENETFAAIGEIRQICQDAGISMSSGALSWLLEQPNVASVIVGSSSVEQVVENCRIVSLAPDVKKKLTEATEELKHILGPNADLWAAVSRMK